MDKAWNSIGPHFGPLLDTCMQEYFQYISFLSFHAVEQYIYISATRDTYRAAEKLCHDQGYSYLAIVDTNERQHMFSMAMVIEYGWV